MRDTIKVNRFRLSWRIRVPCQCGQSRTSLYCAWFPIFAGGFHLEHHHQGFWPETESNLILDHLSKTIPV